MAQRESSRNVLSNSSSIVSRMLLRNSIFCCSLYFPSVIVTVMVCFRMLSRIPATRNGRQSSFQLALLQNALSQPLCFQSAAHSFPTCARKNIVQTLRNQMHAHSFKNNGEV